MVRLMIGHGVSHVKIVLQDLYLSDGYNANGDDDSGRGKNHFEGYT